MKKLKVGDKVYKTIGQTYSWRDTGIIKKITNKQLTRYQFVSVAEVKNMIGETFETALHNLERA